jgi:chloramphenicol 3-O-phosphotransferase
MTDTTTNFDIDNGAELLDDIVKFMRRFIVATDEQLTAAALWIVHTHAFAAAEMTPYLYITSPEKRSGKTRLLKLLQLLCAKPWVTVQDPVAAPRPG